jgi:serine/threonine-protein kinase
MRGETLEGTRLGAYEVGARLGEGPIATVFEGRHVELGKPVAIKVLDDRWPVGDPVRARFLTHARAAAALDHPHAVRLLDVGADDVQPAFLVMELLRGERLTDRLRAAGRMPLPAALALLLPVASALAYAHRQGVSHGRVIAGEIFLPLDRHGDPHPKLVDFRLSARCVEGGAEITPAADLQALAATLLETVTGQEPQVEGFLAAAVADPLLPEAVAGILRRALAPEDANAFPDVHAFARALLPYADAVVAEALSRDFAEKPAPVIRTGAATPERGRDLAQETFLGGSLPAAAAKLPCAPGTSTFYVKGIAYQGVVLLAERKVPGGFVALARELDDPDLLAFVRQPFLSASRYDILPMIPLNLAISRLLNKPLATLAAEQGRAQATFDARYGYRRVFEAMTLEAFHTYVPRIAGTYFDTGECTAERIGPAHVVVHRRRLPEYVLPWFAPVEAAYLEELARSKGATGVQATLRPPLAAASRKGLAIVDLDTELRWR